MQPKTWSENLTATLSENCVSWMKEWEAGGQKTWLQLCYPLSISQIHAQRFLSGAGQKFWQTSELIERKLPRNYELNNTCCKPACQTTDWKQAWKQGSFCFWISYRFKDLFFFFNMIYCFDQNTESLIPGRLLTFLQIWLHA